MNLKAAIKRRVIEQMQRGIPLAEASFSARQWAKRAAAKERLKAKEENPHEEVIEEKVEVDAEEKKDSKATPKRGRPPKRTKR